MKHSDLESQSAALSALQSRLSANSFATGTVANLAIAATALKDIIGAKTADTAERKAQRISDAGQRYLESVNRASNDISTRELGGLAALNMQFAERVNLSTDGYRYATQVLDSVRAANQTEKIAILSQIVDSGDGRAMASILEAPQFTHGIQPEMLSRFRDSMEAKWAPDVTAKREQFKLDLEVAHVALSSAEAIAQSVLKISDVAETLAGAESARNAEQRLQDATA